MADWSRTRSAVDPPPLLVHLHGGPGAVSTNQSTRYRGWPFPVQVYAARGFAVFIPNYRQTHSFGSGFQRMSGLDGDPVDDIFTGMSSDTKSYEDNRRIVLRP